MYNLIGDVDENDVITAVDSLLVLRASVGLENFSRAVNIYADVDGDTAVDSNDALNILRYSAAMSAHENTGKKVKE